MGDANKEAKHQFVYSPQSSTKPAMQAALLKTQQQTAPLLEPRDHLTQA
jgi:hypothetical protein